jgi:hypothetical protein
VWVILFTRKEVIVNIPPNRDDNDHVFSDALLAGQIREPIEMPMCWQEWIGSCLWATNLSNDVLFPVAEAKTGALRHRSGQWSAFSLNSMFGIPSDASS